ncbi:hypothetical protein A3E96_04045 [Candidatus Uhrbacteria bacterium RIFCSPHIGHO2_12_FULL_46_13]|uniref:YdbS-like PH domain-containing protein n=1 Tax=Candidatus Uhrbacteria bacterium RIFCSPLOWO2_01_FULL_47_25 TaxID=1802402 RepID=A0A1F7UTK4_9BACT|nr:MAG: hypothetical protein UX68_C0007G0005 [Parcubacteria group bacterium GW2011_GWA2_46_9]OGL59483.1 MAG: hypothetical protein A2752_02800 [Candidatus Uhrbacteria bacterium RIFCSPHIGHO2_01_FULL_46_23]OGL76251.1 MAG: hypothetical protein A3E96_04045 [Candidatus Uhrbacteria bacterium RIFCSPHIGHO2_12_FULL_46_13]OGL81621.1 MAG: hypothetical protein A2936_04515 [Candidatus Uhrbacteria bacterium RIFCSPLOWO2_01_FULL_47_25]OGL84814.1 MAG: hypothetical protein A3I37_05315 [Candidatus Uhrbacteria bact
MPLFSSPKHIPTSRICPLQYRKIWKKLLVLEISPSPQSQKMWRSIFVSLLSLAGLYIVLGLATSSVKPLDWSVFLAPIIGLFSIIIFLLIFYQWLYIWTYFYDVDESFLKIRKGVIIRREITIPYNRIQDVYLDQDIMDHLFHLYDLYISTATPTSIIESHIDGLNSHNAQKIRDLILAKVTAANVATPNGGV